MEEHDCAICLEPIEDATGHLSLPCQHTFHIECGLRWLRTKRTCPYCRETYECMTQSNTAVVRNRVNRINYNAILGETLRIISQPWTSLNAPEGFWDMMDPDTQSRQVQLWLIEHMRRVFEREFHALLHETYIHHEEPDGVTSESPMDSDHAVLFIISSGVFCMLSLYGYLGVIHLLSVYIYGG